MKKEDKSFLEDILTSIRNIEHKTMNLDYNNFIEKEEIKSSISQDLDSLSGALGICPDGSFRDVDSILVWNIIHKRIPQLKKDIKKSLFQI